jgi:hypothetical protein
VRALNLKRRRRLYWVISAILIVWTAAFVTVQAGQWVARRRAERLLADFRLLTQKQGTWADLQRIQTKWGPWGNYDGTCNAQQCEYQVQIFDVSRSVLSSVDHLLFEHIPWDDAIWVSRVGLLAIRYLGGHAAMMRLDVNVRDGVIERATLTIGTAVPKGYGRGRAGKDDQGLAYRSDIYDLLGTARLEAPEEVQRDLRSWAWNKDIFPTMYHVQPPDGCEGCMGLYSFMSSATEQKDVAWLTDFNMTCITRWTPCTTEADMMPAAWAKYGENLKLKKAANDASKLNLPVTRSQK